MFDRDSYDGLWNNPHIPYIHLYTLNNQFFLPLLISVDWFPCERKNLNILGGTIFCPCCFCHIGTHNLYFVGFFAAKHVFFSSVLGIQWWLVLPGEVLETFPVGGFSPTHLTNITVVKLDHFPNFWGENNKCLSCHHLVSYIAKTSSFLFLSWLQKQIMSTTTSSGFHLGPWKLNKRYKSKYHCQS